MTHYTINEVTPEKSDVTFRGIPYADADRTGHWSIWAISLLFQANRAVSMTNSFMHMNILRIKNVGHVITKQILDINPLLYRYTYKTPIKLRFKMEMKEIGNSSIIFSTRLYDEETGLKLGQNVLKFVQINTETRKSLPFPAWFQTSLSHLKMNGKYTSLNRATLSETPENCFRWKVIVRYSDLDKNMHSNQATYLKLFMDCSTKAAISGYYRHFKTDMCWFNVEHVAINYIGESFVDDELEVHTWQDNSDDSKIFFSCCKDKKRITFAEFRYGLERTKLLSSPKL
ncbi:uncharacterized protein LOC143046695 [Mytilus galloprovincialis]|uniref:uncharacterized protein LOC143046695 n=1 Tax=Mytilus galloprovincialis TaxID=29158 RepID=UPI003F7C2EE6